MHATVVQTPSEAQARLSDLLSTLRGGQVWRTVWNRFLTDEERTQLLPLLEKSKHTPHIVDIWRNLRKCSMAEAAIELGEKIGLLPAEADWLRRELRIEPRTTPAEKRPEWNATRGELVLGGRKIRKVTAPGRAKKIRAILDAFQAEGWPTRIENPLPQKWDTKKLQDAVRVLNRQLKSISFHTSNGCKTVYWRRR